MKVVAVSLFFWKLLLLLEKDFTTYHIIQFMIFYVFQVIGKV